MASLEICIVVWIVVHVFNDLTFGHFLRFQTEQQFSLKPKEMAKNEIVSHVDRSEEKL